MEGMLTFTGIIIIVFGILQIILFFKLWGMTNNIMTIKSLLIKKFDDHTIRTEKKTFRSSPLPNEIPSFSIEGNNITFTDGKSGQIKKYPTKCSIYDENGKEIIYNNRQAAIYALYIFLTTGEICDKERYDPEKYSK